MANVSANRTDYVRFYIQSEIFGRVLMTNEPGGWNDDDLELDRAKHHGIFNKFSNSLKFYKNYRDIIENTFEEIGNSAFLYLIKEELVDTGDDIKWVEQYRGKADWETKKIKDGVLEIKFNSNDLEEKLAANETDEMEIETTVSIDDVEIGELQKFKTSLLGRTLVSNASSESAETDGLWKVMQTGSKASFSALTQITAQGPPRHSSVDTNNVFDLASNMFFVDSVDEENTVTLNIKIESEFESYYQIFDNINNQPLGNLDVLQHRLILTKYVRNNAFPGGYQPIESFIVSETDVAITRNESNPQSTIASGSFQIEVGYEEGLTLFHVYGKDFSDVGGNFAFLMPQPPIGGIYGRSFINVIKQTISFNESSFEEPSIDLSCIFVHDAFQRLIQIIADDKDLFYSKYFGRTELGYAEDGPGAIIGLMSGFWIRAFDEQSERYKSPKFSWKKLLDSCNAVFNVGMGTHLINGKKVVRVEDVKFFYQNEVVVALGQVSNVEREYDKSLYNSGIEMGYNKGGDYENEAGLDEPNTKTSFVTPDRKSKNKYQKISDIRADETEMEIIRRKPQLLFPDEDTGSDEHNWFVDLKRAFNGKFEQVSWEDRLEELPSGVNNPETFRSFLFSPLRMLFRHGWIIRAGLEKTLTKTIKQVSSVANSNLVTHFIGEDQAYAENLPNGLEVNKLQRSRMLPEFVSFEYDLDRETYNKIYGTTRILYNGSYEDVPNYYFKFSWINEKQEIEYGYLLNMKPSDLAKFKMQKSNERPI
jgi:hypothetical protein